MESAGHVTVPLRTGGKKMRKRRELDALVAHSLAKRACNSGKRHITGNGVTSQDQLLSQSTDEQEDYTWPKVRGPSRCRTKRLSCLRTCGPLLLITSVFISLGFMYWLYFDLRQQISEYRMRIEQVSATSQNMPEALQKWHETSKNLEQNQTILYGKISEFQQMLNNYSIELTKIKDTINKQIETSKDNQFKILEDNIAGFGAKIKSTFDDIESLKERFAQLQHDKDAMKDNIVVLENTFNSYINNVTTSNNINNTITPDIIDKLKLTLNNDIRVISTNLSIINDTLSQRTKNLEDDFLVHEKKISTLNENATNTLSHVTSIEDDFTQYKQQLNKYENYTKQITNNVEDLRNSSAKAINILQDNYDKTSQNYNRQANSIMYELDKLKKCCEKSLIVDDQRTTVHDINNVVTNTSLLNTSNNPNISNNNDSLIGFLTTVSTAQPPLNQQQQQLNITNNLADDNVDKKQQQTSPPNTTTDVIVLEGKPKLLSVQKK